MTSDDRARSPLPPESQPVRRSPTLLEQLGPRLAMLGPDGLLTLLLSNLLIVTTLGLTLLPLARRVYRMARGAPCWVPEGDLLVVLGARLEQGQIAPPFRQRLDRAMTLRREAGPIPVLILGGITRGSTLSEAEGGRAYLIEQGLSADSVLIEDQSRNTLENLKHARPIITARARCPVLISNRFHLARCTTLARGIGLEHRVCAAEDRLLVSVPFTLQVLTEAYYLHWYEVGRRWARWTRNRKSLERIS